MGWYNKCMEQQELVQRIEQLEKKVDAVYISAEKSRKYLLTMMIASVLVFVLPLIGLLFAVPSFISTYAAIGNM